MIPHAREIAENVDCWKEVEHHAGKGHEDSACKDHTPEDH